MKSKKNPGLGAGVQEHTPQEGSADVAALAVMPPFPECPAWLASNQFPERKGAILRASDRAELIRAALRFAFAAFFARHSTGRACDLAHEAIAADIRCYARLSRARCALPTALVTRIVLTADEAAQRYAR